MRRQHWVVRGRLPFSEEDSCDKLPEPLCCQNNCAACRTRSSVRSSIPSTTRDADKCCVLLLCAGEGFWPAADNDDGSGLAVPWLLVGAVPTGGGGGFQPVPKPMEGTAADDDEFI